MTRRDECPHCGWTPEEQDKLSNDREELLRALRAVQSIPCSIPFQYERSEFEAPERAAKREAFQVGFNAAMQQVYALARAAIDQAQGEPTCESCGAAPATEDNYGEFYCANCTEQREQNRAESAMEVAQGECFRGGEAEAFYREEQERARRLK